MKKNFMKKYLCLILAMAMMLSSLCLSASAVSEDYSDESMAVIEAFLSSDGAEAEICTYEIMNQFLCNSEGFLEMLSNYPIDAQENVLLHLAGYVGAGSVEERFAFENIIYNYENENALIQKLIIQYEAYINSVPSISDESVPKYDMEIVQSIADAYVKAGAQEDEEFFNYLYNVYSTEPEIVELVVSNYSEGQIAQMARGMVNLCKDRGMSLDAIIPKQEMCESCLFSFISEAYNSSRNIETESFVDSIQSKAVYTPKITSFVYDASKIELGKTVPLKITLTETQGTTVNRSYTVKVFCARNGSEWEKATTTITIPVGATTATKSVDMVFSGTGEFTTRVAVYNGSTLLVSREGKSPDISYGYWKIICTFPKDRSKYGTFGLYHAAGGLVLSGSALGQSQTNKSENVPYGNTPCGTYTGVLAGPHSNTTSYGPNKYVQTSAVNVPAIQKYGRSNGMWIHGGRAQNYLHPTDGCVRVFDADMLKIQNNITTLTKSENGHYTRGNVIYCEQ